MNHLTDGIHRTNKIVEKEGKTFSVRLEISPNTSERAIVENGARELFKAFVQKRNPNKDFRNLRIECILHSADTMFDHNAFSSKKSALQRELAKRGMGKPPISTRHEQSDTPEIIFNAIFFEVDKRDPFYGLHV